MKWIVQSNKTLRVEENFYKVQIGSGGLILGDKKQEGDYCTPCGQFPVRVIYYREDRVKLPEVKIPAFPISRDDGWCDDSKDKDYNKFVKLTDSYNASHEKLWRDDHLYDVIITIGYNDERPVAEKGSAIFIHAARPEFTPTAGCIALELNELLGILPTLDINSCIEIIGDVEQQDHVC